MDQTFSPGSISSALGFLGEQLLLVKHPAIMSEPPDSLAFVIGWHETVAEQPCCPVTAGLGSSALPSCD